jgi:hypothetical protein
MPLVALYVLSVNADNAVIIRREGHGLLTRNVAEGPGVVAEYCVRILNLLGA